VSRTWAWASALDPPHPEKHNVARVTVITVDSARVSVMGVSIYTVRVPNTTAHK
jgi:hypothetical protein